jgi:sortase (surface protein transpeptidase)
MHDKKETFGVFLLALGTVSMAIICIVLVFSWKDNSRCVQGKDSYKKISRNNPRYKSFDSVMSYNVAPDRPKYLEIKSIGISQAKIIALGVNKDNQIINPGNVKDVGWYINSSKPDDEGVVFLYGHLSSWTSNGVFAKLKNIKNRAVLSVSYAVIIKSIITGFTTLEST